MYVFMCACMYAVCIYIRAHISTHAEVAGFIQPLIVLNKTADIARTSRNTKTIATSLKWAFR